MEIPRIDHVQLAMPAGDEDQAREFYFGLLGLPEVQKPPALAQRLRSAGILVVDDDSLPGYDRVYVSDPFGNRLELIEGRKERPRASPQPRRFTCNTWMDMSCLSPRRI